MSEAEAPKPAKEKAPQQKKGAGRKAAAAAEADALLVRAVRVHHVQLLPARPIALGQDDGAKIEPASCDKIKVNAPPIVARKPMTARD